MKRFLLLGMVLALAACTSGRGLTPNDLPPTVDIDAVATTLPLTENAPPPGFREAVAFERVDANLRLLPGWRYEVLLSFDGVFSQTTRPTTAEVRAEVQFNQIGSSRRVIVESSGELLRQPEGASYEAVRLGPDAFLVREQVCLGAANGDAETAASLTAGDLIGGVRDAVPTGDRQILHGEDVWKYSFAPQALNLPSVRFAEDTVITRLTGELWVAPAHNAVVRYWLTMDIENARLLSSELPVTGTVVMRYDLYEVGQVPNITVPFGC